MAVAGRAAGDQRDRSADARALARAARRRYLREAVDRLPRSATRNTLRPTSVDGFIVLRPHALDVSRRNVHRRAANDPGDVPERTAHLHAAFPDRELTDRLVVPRPAHFEHRHA